MEGCEISRLFTLVEIEARRRFPYGRTGTYEGVSANVFGIRIVYSDHERACKTDVLIRWEEMARLLKDKGPVSDVVQETVLLNAAE
jgi:hypothetical protein